MQSLKKPCRLKERAGLFYVIRDVVFGGQSKMPVLYQYEMRWNEAFMLEAISVALFQLR